MSEERNIAERFMVEVYEPISEKMVLQIFRDRGAILTDGHYVLAGDDHIDVYVEKIKAMLSSAYSHLLCREIACRWADENVEVVVAPALAGIKIAVLVALELYWLKNRDVLSMFTEKNIKREQELKRGKEEIRGKRVLIVDDIGTTGGSLIAAREACEKAGAIVIGCQVIIDKSCGNITAEELKVKKYCYLAKLDVVSYPENKCPFCEKEIPINTDYGHGKEYLKKHPEKALWSRK